MILTNFKLVNYGLFHDINEFDLRPTIKRKKLRPIILIGGKNGAGKTTFLDAIRLLLYGKKSFSYKISQKDYDAHLLSKVHRNKSQNTRANYSKIGLEFEHVTGGEKHIYYVERSWTIERGNKVIERFDLLRNGEPLSEIGNEHLESFVADIVPERLSQLFFFDGEKIKGIAEDITSNASIAEAIQSLLGLDAVLALKSDLTVYRNRLLKKANPDEFQKLLKNNEKEIKDNQLCLEEIEDSLASIRSKIEGTQNDIRRIERSLSERGGMFASARDDNKSKSETLKTEINAIESSIRESLEEALPFALCPSLSKELVHELKQEELAKEKILAEKHLQQFSSKLQKAFSSKQNHSIASEFESIFNKETESYLSTFGEYNLPIGSLAHDLSSRESHQVIDILSTRVSLEVQKAKRHLVNLENKSQQLHAVTKNLSKAPDDTDVIDLFNKLTELNRLLGTYQERENKLLDQQRSTTHTLNSLIRAGERLGSQIKGGEKDEQKLDHIRKMIPALDTYKDRLTEVKINTLQTEVTECFNRLARKSDFVKAILIDPKSFQVSVVDSHGRSIPKEDLSSGEKQIFAISMLWGLGRTSGRPLPIVVDTPLGRLDSDHRLKLINNYFPNAGHQVILLSTDTEVDNTLFEKLSPSISRTYHLQYQHDEGKTTFEQEYFWRS